MTDELQYEALHATFIAQDVFDRHVSSHPQIKASPALRRKADAIARLMDQLYQSIDCEQDDDGAVPLARRSG